MLQCTNAACASNVSLLPNTNPSESQMCFYYKQSCQPFHTFADLPVSFIQPWNTSSFAPSLGPTYLQAATQRPPYPKGAINIQHSYCMCWR